MHLLAFDASTPVCPVAAGVVSEAAPAAAPVVADTASARANQASEDLDQRLARALASVAALDGVACGRGPGTFTGIRVALATAMGLAMGRNVPLFTFSSLAALAASAPEDGKIVAAIDARRGEVYCASFLVDHAAGRVQLLDEERCIPGSGPFPAGEYYVGSGFDAHRDALPDTLSGVHRSGVVMTPNGVWIAGCTAANTTDPKHADPASARAVYLRRSYAELGLNTPKHPVHRSPFLKP